MKRSYRLIPLLLLILIPLLGVFPARAQSAAVTMSARAAFGGNFKYGEWLPLWAEIENPGPDLEAELQVNVASGMYSIFYNRAVSLPSGARKRVPVYVLPNNFSRVLEVRLVSGNQLLATTRINLLPQSNFTYLAGILSSQRGAIALLNGIQLNTPQRPKVIVDISLDDLPERAEGLASFDLLVLNDVDTSRLSAEQAAALQGWVQRGGRLVIGGGAGAARTLAGLPAALRPVSAPGSLEVGAAALAGLGRFASTDAPQSPGSFVLALGTPADDARLLAGDSTRPLLVERRAHNGAVDWCALDLAAAPFEGWSGTLAFWQALAAPGSAFPLDLPQDMSVRQMRSGSMYGALTNIPSLDLPSVRSLSILLVAYVLLVGPVNYLTLRRLKRLHLAWISIPALTVLFAAAAFGIGFSLRGNDLVLNKIAIIEVLPDGPARVNSYIGLFSPRRQAYSIEVKDDGLVSPGEQYYYDMGAPPQREMTIQQGNPTLVSGLAVNQWSMQSLMSEDTWADFGALTGDLRLEGDTLRGTVRNDTPYPLRDAVLAVNRRFQRLGDLAPGQEVAVELGLANLNKDWNMSPSLSYGLYPEMFMSSRQPPRHIMLKVNILDTLLESGPVSLMSAASFGAGAGRMRSALLFGWIEQTIPDVSVRGQRITQVGTGLAYAQLDIRLPGEGRVAVPPGLAPGRLLESSSGMGWCTSAAVASAFMDNTQVVFEYDLPLEASTMRLETLTLNIQRDNSVSNIKSLEVYDWQREQWSSVDHRQASQIIIQDAANLVSPLGKVRVRLANELGNPSCFIVDLGWSGQRAQ